MKTALFDKQFVHVIWDDALLRKPCFYADKMVDLIKYVENNITPFKGIVIKTNDVNFPFAPPDCDMGYRFAYCDPNYELKRAYNEGKTIQCRSSMGNWYDCEPDWNTKDMYRVKPAVYYVRPTKYYVGIGPQKTLTWDFDPATYKHVYAYFDSGIDASKWIEEHKKFVPVMCAFERGLTVEYKRRGDDWCIAATPSWDLQLRYRVKPNAKSKRRMTNRELAKWLADGNGQKIEGLNKFVYTTYAYKDGDNVPCRRGVLIRGWNETEWHEPEMENKKE